MKGRDKSSSLIVSLWERSYDFSTGLAEFGMLYLQYGSFGISITEWQLRPQHTKHIPSCMYGLLVLCCCPSVSAGLNRHVKQKERERERETLHISICIYYDLFIHVYIYTWLLIFIYLFICVRVCGVCACVPWSVITTLFCIGTHWYTGIHEPKTDTMKGGPCSPSL